MNDLISKSGRVVEQCFGYACGWLVLSEDFDGLLAIGSDDGYRLWIDDQLFAQKVVFRSAGADQETYPLTLAKGTHRLLLKVHNDLGSHGFYLRLLDKETKQPFRDYHVRIVKPGN